MTAWIFQGNPRIFDVDDYLSRYPQLIYWRMPRYQSSIIGDRAFIWRAGLKAGVIAAGRVVESPVQQAEVKHPEALGDDLWVAETPSSNEPKVGISLDSIRLTPEEGMLPRPTVKVESTLRGSAIITIPQSTVFRLTDLETKRLEELWDQAGLSHPEEDDPFAFEGRMRLRSHRKRERSRVLVAKKLEAVRKESGFLRCELCGLTEGGHYPTKLASRVFEVHHMSPLSLAATPCRTTLVDLAIVCANCHRAIHATSDVEANVAALKKSFSKTHLTDELL